MQLRPSVFFPPFLLLLVSAVLSFLYPDAFLETVSGINQFILVQFGWLFSWATFAFLLVLLWVWFSPLAQVRIGGETAQPLLPKYQWFSITLCTTIATGILFWGIAEPVFHVATPPVGIENPKIFAMSTMYMHWSFTPYGIYTLAGLVFAICFYNLNQPFRVATLLYPIFGNRIYGAGGQVVDALCLFALVAGMAASLGAGILSISGGLNRFLGWTQDALLFGLIGLGIVSVFILSAVSGLQKGIRILSSWNIALFILFALFVCFAGPTTHLVQLAGVGFLDFLQNFVPRSLGLDAAIPASWQQDWTVFYWANWLAWTPVTALFLGRLSRGYTVRQFILFNLIFPALFSCVWMTIFSGTTIDFQTQQLLPLQQVLAETGPQSVVYAILKELPWAKISSIAFLVIVFVSYVTAADSNTSAMTGLSVKGITPETPEAPVFMKILWGLLVGLIAWVMISFAGIDGIKMTSNLGGFPALFIIILVGAGLVILTLRTWK